MKIKQFEIIPDNVIQGIKFENMFTTQIRVKIPQFAIGKSGGLFINNNPYLIIPTFNENGYWELNTYGNSWISSIKFDFNMKDAIRNKSIVVEVFYED